MGRPFFMLNFQSENENESVFEREQSIVYQRSGPLSQSLLS